MASLTSHCSSGENIFNCSKHWQVLTLHHLQGVVENSMNYSIFPEVMIKRSPCSTISPKYHLCSLDQNIDVRNEVDKISKYISTYLLLKTLIYTYWIIVLRMQIIGSPILDKQTIFKDQSNVKKHFSCHSIIIQQK